MATRHLSQRVGAETLARLEAQSRHTGQTRSQLAKTLLEEGLRMETHPGIIFRSGPARRRPVLVGGPDVWEVARVFRAVDSRGDEAEQRTSKLMELNEKHVRTALRYYADFREEIDDWIERVDAESDRAEAAWRREQELLRR